LQAVKRGKENKKDRYKRTLDRGHPGVKGRTGCVGRDTTYGSEHDFIDDKSQSLRSKRSYELSDHWQLRHTLGVFKLDSDFDNTYLTGYTPATNKVTTASPQRVVRQPAASISQASGVAPAILPSDPTPTITPASVPNTAGEKLRAKMK